MHFLYGQKCSEFPANYSATFPDETGALVVVVCVAQSYFSKLAWEKMLRPAALLRNPYEKE